MRNKDLNRLLPIPEQRVQPRREHCSNAGTVPGQCLILLPLPFRLLRLEVVQRALGGMNTLSQSVVLREIMEETP
jgi:hypothetical protein